MIFFVVVSSVLFVSVRGGNYKQLFSVRSRKLCSWFTPHRVNSLWSQRFRLSRHRGVAATRAIMKYRDRSWILLYPNNNTKLNEKIRRKKTHTRKVCASTLKDGWFLPILIFFCWVLRQNLTWWHTVCILLLWYSRSGICKINSAWAKRPLMDLCSFYRWVQSG